MRTPVNHWLKIAPQWYDRLADGTKTHEVRRNDRDFQIGDTLTLGRCPDDDQVPRSARRQCLGMCLRSRLLTFRITHVLPGGQFGIEPGFAVLSLAPVEGSDGA